MKRSDFLKQIGTTAIGGTVLTGSLSSCKDYQRADYSEAKVGWENWSGLQRCNPVAVLTPATDEQLIDAMNKAKGIRFVGSGHSFMPLVPTNDTIISLDTFSGIVSTDDKNITARVKAGSKLAYLSREFDKKGQAFMNLPDINTQTLAGAISTATHGTGKDFKAIHGYIKALKLITPKGEILECSETENPDVFQAAKVSLGCLGAITEVTLQNRKSYTLHRLVTFQTLDWVLQNGTALFDKHQHFEVFYIPHTKMCMVIRHDVHTGTLKPRQTSEDEDGLQTLMDLRNYLSWSSPLRKWAAQLFLEDGMVVEDYSDDSWRLLAQARVSKFNESEYHVPKENAFACFKKVCELIDSKKETFFPVELRIIQGDDAWLSPFYQRDCMSIAIHASNKEEYKYLLTDFGPIYRNHDARPHWGKLNDMSKEQLAAVYPKFNDFLAVRKRCDPEGKLLNDYLKSIFS